MQAAIERIEALQIAALIETNKRHRIILYVFSHLNTIRLIINQVHLSTNLLEPVVLMPESVIQSRPEAHPKTFFHLPSLLTQTKCKSSQ